MLNEGVYYSGEFKKIVSARFFELFLDNIFNFIM